MGALIIVLVASVAIYFTAHKAIGVDHTVQEWEGNASNDTSSKLVFSVGDGLVFKMGGGETEIAQVSKSDYKICRAEAPKAIYRASPTEAISLNKTGNWYFISRVPEHCKSGKKLKITVVSIATNNGNKTGFRFRKAIVSHKGSGSGGGSSGGGNGGGNGGGGPATGTPATTNPLGNRNRVPPKKNGGSSTQELSAMVFKFQVAMAVVCSVLLAGPLFV